MFVKKIKKLRAGAAIMESLLMAGEHHFRTVGRELPKGTRIITILNDPTDYPSFWFILTNEEWPELKEGDPIPEIESPIFEKLSNL